MFLQLKRRAEKGQCHMHGSQDCQQEREKTQENLHYVFSYLPTVHYIALAFQHFTRCL